MTDKITALTDSIDALTAAVEGIGDRVADEMREARLEHRDLTLGDPPGHARIVEDLIAALPRYAAFDPADPRGERAERKCKHDAVEARFRRAVGDARRQVEACNSTATRGLLETAERELADALARRAEAEKDDDLIYGRKAKRYDDDLRAKIAETTRQFRAIVGTIPHSIDAEFFTGSDDPLVQRIAAGLQPGNAVLSDDGDVL
jgi:hypothetical protein